MTSARHLTIQDLLVYLDSVQREWGGDIPCYVLAPGPADVPQLQPLLEAATQPGRDGFVALILSGPQSGRSPGAATADLLLPHLPDPEPGLELLIEPSAQLVDLQGVRCRVWRGHTDEGLPCTVFVSRIALDSAAAERALEAQLPPGRLVELRHVLGEVRWH